jgi:hypothetical protein
MMQDPLKHLSAISALVDTAQRHGSKLAQAQNPDSHAGAAAVGLQHALECAQVQALILRRLLPTPPNGQRPAGNKEGRIACPPDSPEAS